MSKTRQKAEGRKSGTSKNRYGWAPDLPDRRDYLYCALRPVPPTLSPHIDLRHDCAKIEDQGNLGSCTANSLTGALEFLEKKNKVKFAALSRLFIYVISMYFISGAAAESRSPG
jgi:hypothetical protein